MHAMSDKTKVMGREDGLMMMMMMVLSSRFSLAFWECNAKCWACVQCTILWNNDSTEFGIFVVRICRVLGVHRKRFTAICFPFSDVLRSRIDGYDYADICGIWWNDSIVCRKPYAFMWPSRPTFLFWFFIKNSYKIDGGTFDKNLFHFDLHTSSKLIHQNCIEASKHAPHIWLYWALQRCVFWFCSNISFENGKIYENQTEDNQLPVRVERPILVVFSSVPFQSIDSIVVLFHFVWFTSFGLVWFGSMNTTKIHTLQIDSKKE